MVRKKKNAEKPQVAEPQPEVDYGTPRSSDEEGEASEGSAVAEASEQQSGRTSQSAAADSSAQSSEEEGTVETCTSLASSSLAPMSNQELLMLLFQEESTARILALRENRPAPSLSAGSTQVALQLANNNIPVSSGSPDSLVSPDVTHPELSISVDSIVPTPAAAHTDHVEMSAQQGVEESKESFSTSPTTPTQSQPSATLTSQPSATQPSPSLDGPSYSDIVSQPLYRDVAAVAVTSSDLRGVPRLTGSADQNVPEILRHFRVIVGLKAKRVRPNDEKFGDIVALEHVALLGEGHCLTLIQQLLTGQIDTSTATVSSEPDTAGSFASPETWQDMTRALLDLLMPANSIDECARQIANFNQRGAETVSAYAMRYRTILLQFQAAVDRVDDKRTTWSAMTVALWQQGLKPDVRCLQLNDKPATSLKEAIDSARRHEATGLAGGHVSALFQQVPHRAFDRSASRSPSQNRSNSKGRSKGGASSSNRAPARTTASGNRPPRVCTHPTCMSKKGHTTEHCFTRRREEKGTASTTSTTSSADKSKKKKQKRKPPASDDDDSE